MFESLKEKNASEMATQKRKKPNNHQSLLLFESIFKLAHCDVFIMGCYN